MFLSKADKNVEECFILVQKPFLCLSVSFVCLKTNSDAGYIAFSFLKNLLIAKPVDAGY